MNDDEPMELIYIAMADQSELVAGLVDEDDVSIGIFRPMSINTRMGENGDAYFVLQPLTAYSHVMTVNKKHVVMCGEPIVHLQEAYTKLMQKIELIALARSAEADLGVPHEDPEEDETEMSPPRSTRH